MQGVIAAVPTPVTPDGAPISSLFEDHCQWLLTHGCDGLNILGSTGEANSFDTETRRRVMELAARACPADRLMVGTGTPSLAETIALTKYADDLGYGVALVLPPYYYKPLNEEGLIAWYMRLHVALGTRKIAIYFYNFPQMTGLTIPPSVMAELAEAAPQRFTGIKDSSGNLDYARDVLAVAPGLAVFPSSETALERAHADGFAGCISATVNITSEAAGAIWAARQTPPAHLVALVAAQRALLAGPDLIPCIKAVLAQRTGDDRWTSVLPPFIAYASGARLAQQLKAS
ncbi:MAG: dihydrodipicolinate synthase family protein [Pseudomonadota bacterium]